MDIFNVSMPRPAHVEALEKGTAWVEIKPTGKGEQLGLYVEGTLLHVTFELHTYTNCAEALLTYMNSY